MIVRNGETNVFCRQWAAGMIERFVERVSCSNFIYGPFFLVLLFLLLVSTLTHLHRIVESTPQAPDSLRALNILETVSGRQEDESHERPQLSLQVGPRGKGNLVTQSIHLHTSRLN